MLAVARARRRARPASPSGSTCASGDLREPPVTERVPLVVCPFRSLLHMETEAEKLARSAGRARPPRARRQLRLRRLRSEPRGHRGDERPLAGARARNLRTRRLGRGVADALALGALVEATAAIRSGSTGCPQPEWLRLLDEAELERRASSTAGSTDGHTTARRTWSSSHGDRLESSAVVWVIVLVVVLVVLALVARRALQPARPDRGTASTTRGHRSRCS